MEKKYNIILKTEINDKHVSIFDLSKRYLNFEEIEYHFIVHRNTCLSTR